MNQKQLTRKTATTINLGLAPLLKRFLPLVSAVLAANLLAAAEPVLSPVAQPVFPDRQIDLRQFGAVGDGVADCTVAFAKAIATLSEKGGGQLIVPPGIWLTGPIKLRSHINLHLERGALIQFSRDYRLYPIVGLDIRGEKETVTTSPILGQNLEDVAITGEGILDGGGDAWRPVKKSKLSEGEWKTLVKSGGVVNEKGDLWWASEVARSGKPERPRMLRLIGCKKVLLAGVTFQNPPNWTMNPQLSEDVSILNVSVHNSPAAQNSDALDLESCRRAVIRGCTFDTGDDGICIKSGKDAVGRRIGVPTEDVLVEGCTVYHAHGGFTIGSEMSGGVSNMVVTNCTFVGTDTGLRFKSRRGRGGVVENIRITDIRMADISRAAISFSFNYGGKSPEDESDDAASDAKVLPVTEETPEFRDFHIENVICRGAQTAMMLDGLPEMPLRDIALKNVSITSQRGVMVADANHISFENVRVENKTGEALKTLRVKNSKLDLVK
jgi:polygalacturonase